MKAFINNQKHQAIARNTRGMVAIGNDGWKKTASVNGEENDE